MYRDDEIRSLIQAYTHGCVSSAVKGGIKTDSLPDVGKKASANDNVVHFASGAAFSAYSFKEGKTPTMSMSQILK